MSTDLFSEAFPFMGYFQGIPIRLFDYNNFEIFPRIFRCENKRTDAHVGHNDSFNSAISTSPHIGPPTI